MNVGSISAYLYQFVRRDVLKVLLAEGPLLLTTDENRPGKGQGSLDCLGRRLIRPSRFNQRPEVIAFNPSDAVFARSTLEVLEMVRTDGYSGIVVNPAGPSIAFSKYDIEDGPGHGRPFADYRDQMQRLVVRLEQLKARLADATRLVPVDSPGRLPWGHEGISKRAVDHVRADYLDKPDSAGLLGDEFTLRDLRLVHEAIAGKAVQRDTFRRTMEPHLAATGSTTVRGRGRPAELFRRSG